MQCWHLLRKLNFCHVKENSELISGMKNKGFCFTSSKMCVCVCVCVCVCGGGQTFIFRNGRESRKENLNRWGKKDQ